ncbi:MAG: DNA repair protein RecO [Clostridiales bacterium]|nr:MAG: DNA repair protein RecO [Clostridiales bacterium]
MQDCVEVMGLVLKAEPIGEYDKRVVILTRDRGKISAFARGARRQNSKFLAAACPFVFGTFRLLEGRSSWHISEISVSNYFEQLRQDFEGACYGMYFLELCDSCTRENNDEKEVLKLLYQSLRALTHGVLNRRLVRSVFEIKLVVAIGEFPGLPAGDYESDALYAIRFIETTPVERLYTFTVSESVLRQLEKAASTYRRESLPGRFKSLEVLESL